MVLYAIMYWWILLPVLVIYVITLIKTIADFFFEKPRIYHIRTFVHLYGLTILTVATLYDSELFKSKKLLSATLIDDLSSISINLRNDNTFDTHVSGMFGYSEEYRGKYELKGDTIIFLNRPYENNFIPDRVLINHADSAIYINKLKNGEFDQTRSFVNYFRIDLNELK